MRDGVLLTTTTRSIMRLVVSESLVRREEEEEGKGKGKGKRYPQERNARG
jgi:hypothetical protein